MKSIPFRTDLALELRPSRDENSAQSGIKVTESILSKVPLTRVEVLNEQGKTLIGKPIGSYDTLSLGRVWEQDEKALADGADAFFVCLHRAAHTLVPAFRSIFVACTGNLAVTADALGPIVWQDLDVSAHLLNTKARHLVGKHPLSALAPGVTAGTGIETLTLIRAAVDVVKPDLVIAVDALAARSPDRLCTTIQIGTTGIAPGSGIGNRRCALNQETLGVPTIAVGVPTLVDSSTLLANALETLEIDLDSPKIRALLDPERHFFVTHHQTDLAVRLMASIIATGINRLAKGNDEGTF